MKCPKCGYTSFDYLESCKKCGADLTEVKKRFNLRTILLPGVGGKVTHSASDQPAFPRPEHEVALPAGNSPQAAERDPHVGEADSGAFSFEDPDAFPLEGLMATPAEAAASAPALAAVPFAADYAEDGFQFNEEGDGSDFGEENPANDPLSWPGDAAGLDLSPDPPEMGAVAEPAVVGELLTFMEEIGRPGTVAEEAPAEPPLPPAISAFAPPQPSFPAAVAAVSLPTSEVEEDEDEPFRITLDDFDRLEPGGEELNLFESSSPLPGLEGDFAAPVGWSAASAPLAVASDASLAAEETDPVDVDPVAVEGEPPAAVPAGAHRLAASAADILVLVAVFALFVFAGELALQPDGIASARPLTALLLDQAIPYFLVLFCLAFGYFTFFHFLLGQTLGKMLLRLRVETATGEPVTFSRAFLRSTGGLLALLTAGIGYLPALRPGGRALNDRLAGTQVVKVSEVAR